MKVVTSREMKEIDRNTIEVIGIPAPVLMERAGLALALRFREIFPFKKAVVFCGGGNNGGDGLVAARNLFNWGFSVRVFLFANKASLSPDCSLQYRIVKAMGIPVEIRKEISEKDMHGAAVIDAVLGTGISRPVKGWLDKIFTIINSSSASVMSADIPSGISADTGAVLGSAVRADYTVTFGLPKIGHFLHPGAEYTGRLFIEDIGFPSKLLSSDRIRVDMIDREMASGLLPQRPRYSHKGTYGSVLVVAGSKGKTGAALMAAKACLRSGAGVVTIGVPESLADVFQSSVTEEMVLPLPDDGNGGLTAKAADRILEFISEKADVIAIGPGIGVSADTVKIMKELVLKSTAPLVIDADGINSLAGATAILKKAKSPVILTPHPGEMARLLQSADMKVKDIERDRINIALMGSKDTGAYIVLKGAPAVIATPGGNAFINTTGNPGMATAGSGDVLTGIIAGLLGQGLNPADASVLGVYLHGFAGDAAAREKGEHSLVASDIINSLAPAFVSLDADE